MMTLSDFENHVPLKILARGEEYYISDAIESVAEVTPNVWRTTVMGSEVYSVNVSLEGEKIESWHCDCPYDGDLCKHVVVTLLMIRNQKKKKLFISQAEEMPVVVDEEIVKYVVKDEKKIEEIAKLVSFVDPKALLSNYGKMASQPA